MKGRITAIIRKGTGQNGGFGFIIDEDGNERFFHARHLHPRTLQARFEELAEGQEVVFEPVSCPGRGNGLRAEHVEVV